MKIQLVFVVLVVLLLAFYAAFIQDYDTITRTQAGYATFIVMLGALPGVVSLLDRREAGLTPLMPLHGLFYALAFGLPVYSSLTVWRISDSDAITDTLVLTILGLICLYVGYYAFRRHFSRLRPIQFLHDVPPGQQVRLAWILYGMYLLLQFVPELTSLPSVGQLTAPLGYLSLGILFALALNKALPKEQRFLLTAAIVLTFMIKLLSGSLAGPVFLLVFLGVLYWNKKRTIPWHFLLISVLVAILLNPVKSVYRELTWYSDPASQSYLDKALLFYQAGEDYYTGNDTYSLVSEDASTISRIAHIALFGYVINMTPEPVPYWRGGSYATLWTSFIPRIFWLDKPRATIGQEFGHRYYLLGDEDESTSINLPWLPEFYANFGTLGVLGGMFAVGMLFRFLVQKFNAPISRSIEYVLGITITFSLFYAESNFALTVGGLFLTYVAFVVLLRHMTTGSAPTGSRQLQETRQETRQEAR